MNGWICHFRIGSDTQRRCIRTRRHGRNAGFIWPKGGDMVLPDKSGVTGAVSGWTGSSVAFSGNQATGP